MSEVGVRRGPFRFTRQRVVPVVVVLVLLVVGVVLPYFTIGYDDFASQRIQPTLALWPASQLLSVIDLTYIPAAPGTPPETLQQAVDFLSLGLSSHQVGSVVVVVTIIGLFMDEINKFLWWPLHLAGWALVLGTIAVWVGVSRFDAAGVVAYLGPGWVPFPIAGAIVLALTFRSWRRIDTYAGA